MRGHYFALQGNESKESTIWPAINVLLPATSLTVVYTVVHSLTIREENHGGKNKHIIFLCFMYHHHLIIHREACSSKKHIPYFGGKYY